MTISSTTRRAGPFTGNGTANTFPFAFKVFATADVFVAKTATATGVASVLVMGTDYTVSLNADQSASPGGNVVLTSNLPTGYTLTLTSAVRQLQQTDFTNQGGFYPAVLNQALDRLTILNQQLQEEVDRSLKFPLGDAALSTLGNAASRAGAALVFDSSGNVSLSVPVADFAAALARADADAATATAQAVVATTQAGTAATQASAAAASAAAAQLARQGYDRQSITMLGDSRLAQMYADAGSNLKRNAFNFLSQGFALSGQRMRVGANLAVSGQRSDQYLSNANVTAALATTSFWLMVYGVLNDISLTSAGTDYWTAYVKPVVTQWINTGRSVILCTETGANSFAGSAASMGAVHKYNRQIREFCRTNAGAVLFDVAALAMSPSSAMTINPAYSGDGVHVNQMAGGYALGQAFANLLTTLAPPCDGLVYSVGQVFANGGQQWHSNPLWTTTSGGSTSASAGVTVTGTVPAGVTAWGGPSGTSIAVSTVARADGFGNDMQLVITAGAAGSVKAQIDLTSIATENPGDVFYANGAFSLASGATNFQWAGMHLESARGGVTTYVEDGVADPVNLALPSGAYSWVSETERFAVASGTRNWLTGLVYAYFSGAGSATLKVGRVGFWRVPSY